MWKRQKQLIFGRSKSTLMKEVGNRSESVAKGAGTWKRKQFFQNQALPDFQTGYNCRGKSLTIIILFLGT